MEYICPNVAQPQKHNLVNLGYEGKKKVPQYESRNMLLEKYVISLSLVRGQLLAGYMRRRFCRKVFSNSEFLRESSP